MMKKTLFMSLTVLLAACGGESEGNDNESQSSVVDTTDVQVIDLEANNPGTHREYHPNGALSIEGKLNENGNRQGLWISYYDNGVKWSESYYVDGKRDGHSLTFYPNGQVRYVGEYKQDEKVGTWKFYDEEGNLTNEENF